jgi:putative protease
VYLGLKRFSARAEAENFGLAEVDALAAYAHALTPRRRVYATVNTLMLEAELPDLVAALAGLAEVGVDAAIVQDLGAARVLRRHFPSLELHASTQLAVHSLRGVEAVARLGVRRAVAARELTLAEIRSLCGQPDVEIECFIHGAVCYAYSGLCLFSSHALGRSANRGRCAYVCGGSFSPSEDSAQRSGLPFAMKDLALPGRLADLAQAGVASFKIEGRKKSPLYVAAVTDLYRRLLDGTVGEEDRRKREEDLRTVFSRPWTELYLDSARQGTCGDPMRVGHRGAPIGTVTAVRGSRRRGTLLRFTTSRALEVHDGLQVEVPGIVRPYGFSIEELHVAGAPGLRFEVAAGTEVEVTLPPDHPTIPAGAPVHCTSSQAVKRHFRWPKPRDGEFRRRRSIDVEVRVTPERVDLAARLTDAGPRTVQTLEGAFAPARDAGAAAAGARAAFERLGNTAFTLGTLAVEDEQALFVAASQWNRLRRAATEALEKAAAEAREADIRGVLDALRNQAPPLPAAVERHWSLKVDHLASLDAFAAEDWQDAAEVVVCLGLEGDGLFAGLSALVDRIGRERIRLALPPVLRAWDEARLLPQLARLRAEGWRRWEIANPAGWGYLGLTPGTGTDDLDVTADWPLYVLNSAAANSLLEQGVSGFTLSPEDGAENMRALLGAFGARATVLVYQHTPLFLSETCPRANLSGACPGPARCGFERLDLVSDFGNRVRVLSRGCRTIVVSQAPFCLAEVLEDLATAGAASFRVDLQFGDLTPEAARDTWRRVRAGRPVEGSHAGNYCRGLL